MNEIDHLLHTLEAETVSYVMGVSPNNAAMTQAVNAVRQYVADLEADKKCFKEFADLWYYATDKVPMQFERIVTDWSPKSWMSELLKLRSK